MKAYEPKVQVLIVDDDEEQRRLFSRYCDQMQLTTAIFENGQSVLEYVEHHSRRPSVYMVDLTMPTMDGFTLLERLRAADPDAVVLIVTGLDEPEAVIRAMKLGAFNYVIKPPDREQLRMAFARAFEFHHLRAVERELRIGAREKLSRQLTELTGGTQRRREDSPLERESIRNLSALLSQGEGIGTMSMLIDFLSESAADGSSPDSCTVDPQVAHMLFDNLPSVEGVSAASIASWKSSIANRRKPPSIATGSSNSFRRRTRRWRRPSLRATCISPLRCPATTSSSAGIVRVYP